MMSNIPANRLERHWPKPAAPEAEQSAQTDVAWQKAAKSWEENLEIFMVDHPKLTVAAAAALGMVLGWMIKRK